MPALKDAVKVSVVAPASKCSKQELKEGLSVLANNGVKGLVPKNIFGPHPFCANSQKARLEQFIQAAFDPHTQSVLTVRGGYGSSHLIPELLKLKKKPPVKRLFGYSDISWLHHFVTKHWGWTAVHGPLLCELGPHAKGQLHGLHSYHKKMLQLLKDPAAHTLVFKNLKPLNLAARKQQKIKAPIVGGNLSVIQTMIGTSCPFDARHRLLFLEDIGERGYSVERMLYHLEQAGVFKQVRGVLLGDFTGGNEASGKNYVKRALKEFFFEKSYPVYSGLKCGHGIKNEPLVFNCPATVADGQLLVEVPPCQN